MELSQLPKETLIKFIELLSKQFIVIDGLWFTEVEKQYGTAAALEMDTMAWEKYGAIEATRIKKSLKIEGDGLQALSKSLYFQAWLYAMGFDIKTEEDKVVLTITDCRPQKARVRDGRGEFACKGVGVALFEGFIRAIDPKLKMKCLLCPPDRHPQDEWCKWEFTLEETTGNEA